MSAINTAQDAQLSTEAKLLESYQPFPDAYDELTSGTGQVRSRWQRVLEAFVAMGGDATQAAQEKAERLLVENGVTFADRDNSRPWRLDLFPLLIEPDEWSAIERGVTPQRLAKALNVNISQISKKLTLLNGLCPEVVELLADRQFSADISRVLRKMKPTRQVECVELMVSANNITSAYAEAMLVATPANLLVEGKKPQRMGGVSQEQIAKMEREMSNLQVQYKSVEQTYGQDVLHLVLAKGYLAKLLENKPVSRYLKQREPEVYAESETIVQTVSIDQ